MAMMVLMAVVIIVVVAMIVIVVMMMLGIKSFSHKEHRRNIFRLDCQAIRMCRFFFATAVFFFFFFKATNTIGLLQTEVL